jgi:hypothetical protein
MDVTYDGRPTARKRGEKRRLQDARRVHAQAVVCGTRIHEWALAGIIARQPLECVGVSLIPTDTDVGTGIWVNGRKWVG